jgi:tRNA 2-thiouridine synthesizing protein D
MVPMIAEPVFKLYILPLFMKFAVQLNSSPYASSAGLDAYLFVQAALVAGHQVLQVFFYQDGIYHAFGHASPPDDEIQFSQDWSRLAEQYQLDLLVCISAAQRRGLLHADEAARQGKQDDELAPGFRIGGLGQWLEASLQADRCLVFA